MLVDPEVSPCAGSLAEAADSDVAGMLAEEPASGRLLFDVSGSGAVRAALERGVRGVMGIVCVKCLCLKWFGCL